LRAERRHPAAVRDGETGLLVDDGADVARRWRACSATRGCKGVRPASRHGGHYNQPVTAISDRQLGRAKQAAG
jgi:hypothetical protein